jgi:hypothetical protein
MPAKRITPPPLREDLEALSPDEREKLFQDRLASLSPDERKKLLMGRLADPELVRQLRIGSDQTEQQPAPQKRKRKRGQYHKPERDNIKAILKELYGGDPPATIGNSEIIADVTKALGVSETPLSLERKILRCAGRAK